VKLANTSYNPLVPAQTNEYTIGEWLDEGIQDYAQYRVQESTLKIYVGQIEKYIKPYIGDFGLESISVRDLKIFWWDKIRELKNWILRVKKLKLLCWVPLP
jgi:hypothetical protein